MRLNGRRESSNISDRRGSGGARGLKIGGGIGAVIIAAIIAWISGGNPLDVITSNVGNLTSSNHTTQNYTPTEEEEELAQFSRQILAGTEDVWTKLLPQWARNTSLQHLYCSPMPYRAPVATLPRRSGHFIAPQTNVFTLTCHFSVTCARLSEQTAILPTPMS